MEVRVLFGALQKPLPCGGFFVNRERQRRTILNTSADALETLPARSVTTNVAV